MEDQRSLQARLIETGQAKEAVLHANTPLYLLSQLRKDTSASYVAHELATKDIIDMLRKMCDAGPATAIDLVHSYVLLAALGLKEDIGNFRGELQSIDLSCIQWGDQIRNMLLNEQSSTTQSEVRYQTLRSMSVGTTTTTAPVKIADERVRK